MHVYVERTEDEEIKAIQFGSVKWQPEAKIKKLQYTGLRVTNTLNVLITLSLLMSYIYIYIYIYIYMELLLKPEI
jgi:preprotein translocase subunit SecF